MSPFPSTRADMLILLMIAMSHPCAMHNVRRVNTKNDEHARVAAQLRRASIYRQNGFAKKAGEG